MSIQRFKMLTILGFIIISYFSLILPKDPFKIVPSLTVMTCDKPLWFCIDLIGNFVYFLILTNLYDRFNQNKK